MTLVIFFLDSMELLYKTSDGIQQSDDVTWLNRIDYRLSLKVSKKLGFNRASAVQSMDFAATNQRELAAWKTFLTTLRVKILTIVRKTNCWIDTELTNVWQVNDWEKGHQGCSRHHGPRIPINTVVVSINNRAVSMSQSRC